MSIVFTPFTHEDMVEGIHAIADAVEAWSPTLLVGIGRGGLAPAVFLSHRLALPLVSVDHSAKIAEFGAALVPVLAARTHAGDRVLLVEDINDSGKTIGEIRAMLAAGGALPDQLRIAVLLDNIRSSQRVDYAFRTIDRDVQKDWFVFPWEAMASPESLAADALEIPERIA